MVKRQQYFKHYLLEREIGRGVLGTVFAAYDQKLQRHVAMKIFLNLSNREKAARRLQTEAKVLADLNQPEFLTIYEMGEFDSQLYLVTEFIPTMSLKQRPLEESQISVAKGLSWLIQVANAMELVHSKGYVHKNLKPQNLFLVHGSLKIGGFGQARMIDNEESLTFSEERTEANQYSAPECLTNDSYDNRADIYSMGAIAYEWLTGRQPFVGKTAATLHENILNNNIQHSPEFLQLPPAVRRILTRCMALKPEDRYQDCQSLIQACEFAESNSKVLQSQSALGQGLNLVSILTLIVFLILSLFSYGQGTGLASELGNSKKELERQQKTAISIESESTDAKIHGFVSSWDIIRKELTREEWQPQQIYAEMGLFLNKFWPFFNSEKDLSQSQRDTLKILSAAVLWDTELVFEELSSPAQKRLTQFALRIVEEKLNQTLLDKILLTRAYAIVIHTDRDTEVDEHLQGIKPQTIHDNEYDKLNLSYVDLSLLKLKSMDTVDSQLATKIAHLCLDLSSSVNAREHSFRKLNELIHFVSDRCSDRQRIQILNSFSARVKSYVNSSDLSVGAFLADAYAKTTVKKADASIKLHQISPNDRQYQQKMWLWSSKYIDFRSLAAAPARDAMAQLLSHFLLELKVQENLPSLFATARQIILLSCLTHSFEAATLSFALKRELKRRQVPSSSSYFTELKIYEAILDCFIQGVPSLHGTPGESFARMASNFQRLDRKVDELMAKLGGKFKDRNLTTFISAIKLTHIGISEPLAGSFQEFCNQNLKQQKLFQTFYGLSRDTTKIRMAFVLAHRIIDLLSNSKTGLSKQRKQSLFRLLLDVQSEINAGRLQIAQELSSDVRDLKVYKLFMQQLDSCLEKIQNENKLNR